MNITFHQVSFLPVRLDQFFDLVFFDVAVIDRIEVSSLFLRKFAKVSIRDESLVASVQVIENNLELADLEFDSHVVQSLLELVETDSIVKVNVKEPVSLSQSSELFVNLNPQQIKDLLKRSSLDSDLRGGGSRVDV